MADGLASATRSAGHRLRGTGRAYRDRLPADRRAHDGAVRRRRPVSEEDLPAARPTGPRPDTRRPAGRGTPGALARRFPPPPRPAGADELPVRVPAGPPG